MKWKKVNIIFICLLPFPSCTKLLIVSQWFLRVPYVSFVLSLDRSTSLKEISKKKSFINYLVAFRFTVMDNNNNINYPPQNDGKYWNYARGKKILVPATKTTFKKKHKKTTRVRFTCLFICTVLILHPEAWLRCDGDAFLLHNFSENAGLLLIRNTTCSFFPVLSTSSIWFTIFMSIWLLKKSFATAPMMPKITVEDNGITHLPCAYACLYNNDSTWYC